jgi:hypothetical protein
MTKNKRIRNIIFRVCGVGMLASYVIMLFPHFYAQAWVSEALSLFFFGISFLTKANIYAWLFCDKSEAEAECASNEEKCVACGETIPEGRQVCPNCEGSNVTNGLDTIH